MEEEILALIEDAKESLPDATYLKICNKLKNAYDHKEFLILAIVTRCMCVTYYADDELSHDYQINTEVVNIKCTGITEEENLYRGKTNAELLLVGKYRNDWIWKYEYGARVRKHASEYPHVLPAPTNARDAVTIVSVSDVSRKRKRED